MGTEVIKKRLSDS